MDKCEVKLTVSRSGPAGSQNRGDNVEVGLLEAGRLVKRGDCEKPDAKTLKAIAKAEAAAKKETAQAAPVDADKAAAAPVDAGKAAADQAEADQAAAAAGGA